MKPLSHLFNLFYPRVCQCCEAHLLDQEKLICLSCRFDLPFVDNGDYTQNPITKIFAGRIPVELGASFLFYHEIGKTKQLIHQLKYQNNQQIGTFFAIGLEKNSKNQKLLEPLIVSFRFLYTKANLKKEVTINSLPLDNN